MQSGQMTCPATAKLRVTRDKPARAEPLARSDITRLPEMMELVPLPHIPGHELGGTVVQAGSQVTGWQEGTG